MSGVGFDPKNRGTLKDYEGCGPVANWKLPGKSLREREDAKASAKDSPRNPNKNANRVDPSRNFEGGGVNKGVGQAARLGATRRRNDRATATPAQHRRGGGRGGQQHFGRPAA